MSRSDHSGLGRVLANTRLKRGALQLLYGSGILEALPVGRILVTTGITSQKEFETGVEVLDRIREPLLQRALARLLLRSLFAHSGWCGIRPASDFVGKLSGHLEAMEIISDATDHALTADKLNANIALLNAVPEPVRTSILERVDQLSERIINFRKSSFNLNSTTAWAGLITAAGEVNRRAQLRAAELLLPFALRMRYGPASLLIIATFPLVHAELARGKAAPSLLSFFFSFW